MESGPVKKQKKAGCLRASALNHRLKYSARFACDVGQPQEGKVW